MWMGKKNECFHFINPKVLYVYKYVLVSVMPGHMLSVFIMPGQVLSASVMPDQVLSVSIIAFKADQC
jgi:hypothetical protein